MKHIRYYIAFCLLAFMPFVGVAQTPVFSLSTGLQMTVGETIDVQLSVDTDLSPHNVLAYTFAVSYNSNLLQVKNVQYDTKLQNFSNVANTQQAGKVKLSGAATSKIEGNGTLITLTFEALAAGNTSLSFVVAECLLNEGTPVAYYQNGNIVIANKPSIKVSPNTSFLVVGQTVQCNVTGNVTSPVTWGVTNSLVASVSETGLVTALAHGSTKIFAVDAVGLRDTTDGFFGVTAIRLSIPTNLQQWQGWEITIPVYTTDFSSIDIVSGQFRLTYNAGVLHFLGVDKVGTLLESASVSANETVGGTLNVAFASAQPLGASSAELIKLRFQVLPNATTTTGLNFSNVIFNEDIAAVTDNGSFIPKILPVLVISPTSASLLAGDSLLFTASNGNPPYTWTVSDSRVAIIRQSGWLIGYEGGTTDLTVTDAVGATKTISNISVSDIRMYFPVDTLVQVESIIYTDCFTDSIPIGRPAISAIEGEISIFNDHVKILDIETDGTYTAGWQKVITRVNDHYIKFYLAGATPFRERGIAFRLKAELLPAFKEAHKADVRFHNTLVNEGTPNVRFINGSIEGKVFIIQDKTTDCLGSSFRLELAPGTGVVAAWQIRAEDAADWTNLDIDPTTVINYTPQTAGKFYLRVKFAGDRGYSGAISITVPEVDVRVTRVQNVLTALAENATYQWLDCDNSFEPIDGATNQSFTGAQDGSYAVVVTQNGCTDTSDCYTIATVGILENTFGDNITVYPNPTDGILHIDLGETLSEVTVNITDVSGKLLKQSTYKNTQKLELNLDVQPGFYLLTIDSENKKAIRRLIKN